MLRSKRIIILTLLLLLSATLCSCTPNAQPFEDITVDHIPTTFEESLSQATDIVSATYTGYSRTTEAYQDLVFTPLSQIKGNDIPDWFLVRVYKDSNGAVNASSDYQAEETYILILKKRISVYHSSDIYVPIENAVIIDDSDEIADNSADTSAIPNLPVNKYTVSYIKEYVKNDTSVAQPTGTEYIRSTDLVDIVSGSSVIAKVTPIEYVGGSKNNDTDQYLCRVESVLKGELPFETVTVIFISDTVKTNSQYIVMIEQLGTSDIYILSSRNSVHPAKNSVVKQIEEAMAVK